VSKNREKFVECRTCQAREATIPHDGHSKESAARRLMKRCAVVPKMCSILTDSGSGGGGVL
jgi:hypothetical protein